MAGVHIEVNTGDLQAIHNQLDTLANLGDNLRPALSEIGDYLVSETTRRFQASVGPDGNKWDDVKRQGKALVDKGHLRDSIHYEVNGESVKVGTNLVYAAIHQFGGVAGRGGSSVIAARPFLGISFDDELEIGDILTKHIQRQL